MRTESEILSDILFYRDEKNKFIRVQLYDKAYDIRELERSIIKELLLLKIEDLSTPQTYKIIFKDFHQNDDLDSKNK